jgi:hypothetical protein
LISSQFANKHAFMGNFATSRYSFLQFMVIARAERDKTKSVFAIAAIRLLILPAVVAMRFLSCNGRMSWSKGLCFCFLRRKQAECLYTRTFRAGRPSQNQQNPYVIVGEKERQNLVNLRKVCLRICKVARLKDVRIHDLRHSFASVGVCDGASMPLIASSSAMPKVPRPRNIRTLPLIPSGTLISHGPSDCRDAEWSKGRCCQAQVGVVRVNATTLPPTG